MSGQFVWGFHLQENVDEDLEALEVDILEKRRNFNNHVNLSILRSVQWYGT